MGAILVIILCILASVIVYAIKTTNDEEELLRNKNTAASPAIDNETQTTEDAPNDGSTPTSAQPVAQGTPLTREELDRLLFKYHDKMFGTIVKAILMAMFLWSAIGGIVAGLIIAANT
nr:MAG TPA: hypothetical protein [Caudoviricetes sp.]